MTLRNYVFIFISLCSGYILQYLPLTDFMSWFVPEWVLLIFIFWQMNSPKLINFWWVWPIGLLMDVQNANLLGTAVIGYAVVLYCLQLSYQRLRAFNVAQQTMVVFLLMSIYLLVTYWSNTIVDDINKPFSLWLPALVSALVWPWLYLLLSSINQKLR